MRPPLRTEKLVFAFENPPAIQTAHVETLAKRLGDALARLDRLEKQPIPFREVRYPVGDWRTK